MGRKEILRKQREKVMDKLLNQKEDRTKLLIELMDIDDEIEEIHKIEHPSFSFNNSSFQKPRLNF